MTHHERIGSKLLSLKKFITQLEGVSLWLNKNKSEIAKYRDLSLNRNKNVNFILVRIFVYTRANTFKK